MIIKQSAILLLSLLLLLSSFQQQQQVHAWNYTLSLKKEKRVAVVLGVFGHTEYGKTQVSVTNLILEPSKSILRTGEQQPQFTAKAWLELRKVKSITAAKKLKKKIEKDEIKGCHEIENSRLGQDDDDDDSTSTDDTKQNNSKQQEGSTTNKPVIMKHYLKYLKAAPHEEEEDLKANVVFTTKEAGLYALFYARCISPDSVKVVSSASSIKVSQYNPQYSASSGGIDVGSTYLSVGEAPLPTLYGGFAVIFALGTYFWFRELRKVAAANHNTNKSSNRVSVMKIHYAMLLVGGLKALTLLLESGVYAHRNRTGATGALVDVVFMLVAAAKTAILFIIIILLGTGWSISKAVVTEREQKLIVGVLVVQIIVNIALASLEEGAPVGVETVEKLRVGLRVLDVLCALLILLPIILRTKSHHESAMMSTSSSAGGAFPPPPPPPPTSRSGKPSAKAEEEEELEKMIQQKSETAGDDDVVIQVTAEDQAESAAVNQRELHRLQIFRTFYITTFAFLYFTRLVVPYLEKHLSYLFLWMSHLMYELAALVFYYITCKLFHPENLNVTTATATEVLVGQQSKSSNNKSKGGVKRPDELDEVDLS